MDRDATIAALRALYQTRLSMSGSHLSSDLLPPSPEGWTFEPSKLAKFTRSKSPEVVDLLRHLPFCRSNVAPSTSVIDYCNDDWYGARHAGNPWGGEAVVEAYELPLTMQVENVGTILVLDVRTGMLQFLRIYRFRESPLLALCECKLIDIFGVAQASLEYGITKTYQVGGHVRHTRAAKRIHAPCSVKASRVLHRLSQFYMCYDSGARTT